MWIERFGQRQNQQQNQDKSGKFAVSEELKDDLLNQNLTEAFNLKRENKNQEALVCYQAVLNDEIVQACKIDKHKHMKFNACRNMGEVYERLANYKEAKHYYTLALKMKETDPFLWTRLGFIEYEQFQDHQLAKKCFEAAAQTFTTIQRRSSLLNPIFMKLAEISFQEYNFKKAEEFVNEILQRSNDKDLQPMLFAYLLKSFFLSLQNQQYQSHEFMNKARIIKPDCSYHDLEIIKKFTQQITQKYQTKDFVITNHTQNSDQLSYHYLRINTQQVVLELKPGQESSSFMNLFDDFLTQMVTQCEKYNTKEVHKARLMCSSYVEVINGKQIEFQKDWQNKLTQYNQLLYKKERALCSENDQPPVSQTNNLSQNSAVTSKRAANQGAASRNLRSKRDPTELQMKMYKLNAIKSFKDFTLEKYNSAVDDRETEYVFSHKEIMNAKFFFQKQQTTSNQDTLAQNQVQDNDSTSNQNNTIGIQELTDFELCLKQLDSKGFIFVFKNILKYLLDYKSKTNNLVNFNNSCSLYRIFLQLICNDFKKQNLEMINSLNILISIFEMALFNKAVIKHIKSNALISHRQKMFEYFEDRQPIIEYELEKQKDVEELKIRFYYAMMFYAFEIKNDMSSSIKYFQLLNMDYLRKKGVIILPWVSSNFILDEKKVNQYGSCKIREAQVVRDFDESLMDLKLSEIREIEESKKKNDFVLRVINKIKPDFAKFGSFYLDQLCQYLQKSYQSESAFTANFSTNEEKIKEMWNKLIYCVCRCETKPLFKISLSLFSILTAFQYLHKQFYDQFILKKLEFEPLLTEISERLRLTQYLSEIFDVKHELQKQYIQKTKVHLLRLFTPEFMHFNIIFNMAKQSEQCQQLLQSYFQSLFFLEVFQALLNGTSNQDILETLNPLVVQLKLFDKLTAKNNEIFVKAYLKLLTIEFPLILGFFNNNLKQVNNKESMLVPQNELLVALLALLKYFFETKFDIEEIQTIQNKQSQSADNDESEEEKQVNNFRFLDQLKSKNQKVLKVALQGPVTQLQFLHHNAAVDLPFMSDLVTLCNSLSQNRFMQCGQIKGKEIQNVITLLDTVARHLIDNLKFLREKCPKHRDIISNYKQASKSSPSTFEYPIQPHNSTKCYCDGNQNCFGNDQKLFECYQNTSFFLLNTYAHFAIESSPFQIVTFNPKESLQLSEALPNLTSSKQPLKNLRYLAHLDLQYTGCSPEMSYILSLFNCEYFQLSNESKLQLNYTDVNSYMNHKRFYSYAENCLLIALQSFCQQHNTGQGNLKNGRWDDLGIVGKIKLCVNQLLYLIQSKKASSKLMLQTYQDRGLEYSLDIKQKKLVKLRMLNEKAFELAQVCEKLERLQISHQDPRRANKNQQFQVQLIIDDKQSTTKKYYIRIDKLDDYEMSNIQYGISFQYLYIQADVLKNKAAKPLEDDQPESTRIVNKFEYLLILKNALEIANINKQLSGAIETYIKILRGTIKLAMMLKYQKDTLSHSNFQKLKEILEAVTKVVLGEKVIFRYIQDQISQVNKNQQPGTNLKAGATDLSTAMIIDEGNDLTNTILLDDKVSASIIRTELFQTSNMLEFNQFENILFQLYKTGDELYSILNQQMPWVKAKLQYYQTKSLFEEIITKQVAAKHSGSSNIAQFQRLSDMLKPTILSIHTNEDQQQAGPYIEGDVKNMITSMNHQAIQLTNLRLKVKSLFIMMNEKCMDYDAINEIYKRMIVSYKQMFDNKSKEGQQQKLIEIQVMFKMSKDKYMSAINLHIDRQLELYLQLRKIILDKNQTQGRPKMGEMSLDQAKTMYQQFRDQMHVTRDQLPKVLKDIFELFIDSNMKKGFLNQRKLIDDKQKYQIRQSLLKCCAICGPDSELESGKITSKFLDLSRINADDYAYEGLMICIKWFMTVLETRQNKKEQEMLKKLKLTMEEIDKAIKEQQQQMLLVTNEEMVFRDAQQ